MKNKKMKSIVAFCLAFVVLITGVVAFSELTTKTGAKDKKFVSIDSNDREVINQIANTTGAKVEHITKLRQQGKDWNEILELVKTGNYDGEIDTADYKSLLEQEDKQEVEDVRTIVERVSFALKEIYSKKQVVQKAGPEIEDVSADKDAEEDIEEYYKLFELFENDKLIYLCMKLKAEYDTYENVIDEYLYCLQIEIDLADLLKNKDGFEKQMQEKGVLKNRIEAITINKIEFKMLEVVKNSSDTEVSREEEKKDADSTIVDPTQTTDHDPVKAIIPKKPQEEVLEEIEKIKEKGRY